MDVGSSVELGGEHGASLLGRLCERRKLYPTGSQTLNFVEFLHQPSWSGWYEDEDLKLVSPRRQSTAGSSVDDPTTTAIAATTTDPNMVPLFRSLVYLVFELQSADFAPFLELNHIPKPPLNMVSDVFVCHRCFTPFYAEDHLAQHLALHCRVTSFPGDVMYAGDNIQIRVIDGSKELWFCRCLAMFGRCFVTSKDLVNDVALYEFYLLTLPSTGHARMFPGVEDAQWQDNYAAGYFCRRKHAPDETLAAICVFPPFHRRGFGYFLLDAAYHLTHLRQSQCGCRRCGAKGTGGKIAKPFSQSGEALVHSYWGHKLGKDLVGSRGPFPSVFQDAAFHADDMKEFLFSRKRLFLASEREDDQNGPARRLGGILVPSSDKPAAEFVFSPQWMSKDGEGCEVVRKYFHF